MISVLVVAQNTYCPCMLYENLVLCIINIQYEVKVKIMRNSYSESASEVTFENSAYLKWVLPFLNQGLV